MSASRSTLHAELAFIDSSAYLALVNPHDAHHAEARAILSRLTEERWRSFTTNFVIVETHALFLIRLGHSHAAAFLRQFEQSSTTVVRVSRADESAARSVIFRYEDKDFSYADATSFAVMQRIGIRHAFAFDHHFGQYGPNTLTADQLR